MVQETKKTRSWGKIDFIDAISLHVFPGSHHSIYLSQDRNFLVPVVFFAESVLKTILWAFWPEQYAPKI